MIKLDNVTLVIIDTRNIDLALEAIDNSIKNIEFHDILFFTDKSKINNKINSRIKIIQVNINNIFEYNFFILKKLVNFIKTPYVQVIQWDGYVLDYKKWNNTFLNYDYIGAPWFYKRKYNGIGNGGFSFRSIKLMKYIAEIYEDSNLPEDVFISIKIKGSNFKIAEYEIAKTYSFEVQQNYGQTFGFHGLSNFYYIYNYNEILKKIIKSHYMTVFSGEFHSLINKIGYDNVCNKMKIDIISKLNLVDNSKFLSQEARGLIKCLIKLKMKGTAFKLIILRISNSRKNLISNIRLLFRLVYG